MTSRPIAPIRPAIPLTAWQRVLGQGVAEPGRSRVTHETLIDDGPWGGVPLGGLGSGSIGRTPRGDFARWHLGIGTHRFETVPACQFSLFVASWDTSSAHVLSTIRPDVLKSWNWDFPIGAGRYHGLFPSAWFDYDWDELPVRVTQRQFSPVIPGNYRESSYPVGLFECLVENRSQDVVTVGLMFTWQNLVGGHVGLDRSGGHRNRTIRGAESTGILLSGPDDSAGEAWAGSFAVAAAQEPGVFLSSRNRFDADDGADVWADFATDGRLDDTDDPTPSRPGEAIGAAIAATVTVPAGESRTVTFALAWDFPVTRFGSGRRWAARYTRWFGTGGQAALEIAAEGLAHRTEWQATIDAWQAPILADPDRPDWYKAALFNELYFLVDGGTFWAAHEASGETAIETGPFALLECFDYPFYNTLDVYFYASFALVHLWPELAKRMIRDFAAAVEVDDREVVPVWATGGSAERKHAGALPHDVGGPADDPFVKLNHYHLQDVNIWKDLNSKFVLLVWQSVALLDDEDLMVSAWPAVVHAIRHLAAFDEDGDGLLDHAGLPDQTYDTWPMHGPSAYAGSLWIASLRAGIAMGRRMDDGDAVDWMTKLLARARPTFEEKLWTGSYYRYDAGVGPSGDSVMADQLAGQWWADATGLEEVAPAAHILAALETIYTRNVRGFGNGQMGAVNGTRPDGTTDVSSEQSQEVWTGTAFALAAFMIHRGLAAEAWATAEGVDRVIEARGYRFRTPEAYDVNGNFRATMYMRPLAIWSIEHALAGPRG